MQIGSVLFSLAPFFFIGKLVSPSAPSALVAYGSDYFSFVLLGIAFGRYTTVCVSSLGAALREEQLQGTLEALLLSPASLAAIVLGSVVWPLVWTSIEVALYLLAGFFLFDAKLGHANGLSVLVVFILGLAGLGGLGLLSSCGILLFKEADPVTWAMGGLMKFLSGVYFPVTLLPGWMQLAAAFLPLTYFLDALRQAILLGKPLSALVQSCSTLVVFCVVIWPVAISVFVWTLRRLRQTGALLFR